MEGTTFRHSFLAGVSRPAASPTRIVRDRYDLLLMAASWDSRCLCLLETAVTATQGIGVFFENRGVLGLREKHDPLITEFLHSRCEATGLIEHASEDLDGLWNQLWTATWATYAEIGRPLDVLLDLSTCPRYYAMALLAGGFRKGIISRLTCFYAEGRYPDSGPANENEQFTAGRWETRPIPSLIGTADPGKQRLYVVSVGFEGSKTFRAVTNDDADRVMVLFPRPGVLPEYPDRTRTSNLVLYEEYDLQDADEIVAPAGDAVAAWRALVEHHPTRPTENPFYLCCGTKPHSLGMALHALIDERVTVLYAKPASHKEFEIVPLDSYWTFEIRDTSLPTRNRNSHSHGDAVNEADG